MDINSYYYFLSGVVCNVSSEAKVRKSENNTTSKNKYKLYKQFFLHSSYSSRNTFSPIPVSILTTIYKFKKHKE